MAILNLKNVTVARTFYNGLGASFKETFTRGDGTEGSRQYSAFFDQPHGLSEGDVGNASGLFGAKVNEYEKDGEIRHSVDVTLNKARFEPTGDSGSDDSPF